MLKNYLKMEFPSLPQNVGLARSIVATFAAQLEFTLSEVEEIRVAISEAVSNCVIHAYPKKPGIVQLELMIERATLTMKVKDFGKGISDIEQAKQATFSTDPERMGLGLVFMESFMDEMNISSRPQEGTTVIMKKRPERGFVNVGISRSC
ncbi:stage II sporulation protein AB (anti-sigma F factor) [Hydrogenispora ethanolica]|jgi:stage II sporulation protein AB (anti-sigma F factor)|uniref:Stage II sporulation protein AB (Anti-sigma F factor) n=1 Tax=Hydrogenispora ethanolica TaxID=1082276 RepID=A0A4R1RE93_HYDET|nr:anti-sigma F factor [Hydrogenispora ethanolica]TCL64211.1 stage II sporulation protein AB (anti-sigma F factor) [Hydrogenispora ethanolica]